MFLWLAHVSVGQDYLHQLPGYHQWTLNLQKHAQYEDTVRASNSDHENNNKKESTNKVTEDSSLNDVEDDKASLKAVLKKILTERRAVLKNEKSTMMGKSQFERKMKNILKEIFRQQRLDHKDEKEQNQRKISVEALNEIEEDEDKGFIEDEVEDVKKETKLLITELENLVTELQGTIRI